MLLGAVLGAAPALGETLGSETQRPLPRFVSMKAGEANVRRGPSLTHRVDWVFRHRGLPLMVTAEYGHWRRVRDRDGIGGWMHYAMLSGARTAVVVSDMTELRRQPDPQAPVVARAERDAVVRITRCSAQWCRVSAGSHRGWVGVSDLWGATTPEID
ncbi:MAG: SH3 domain-containing protein [Rhodobacteraceae bacterium]|nr:SH3 domain-containing protein [Paracoccaceae bacterium]